MANFGSCIEWVLRLEDRTLASNTVDLKDGAGLTRLGVTQKNCPSLPSNYWEDTIAGPRMSNADALEEAKQIYYTRYWTPIRGVQLTSDELAATLLSFAINEGVGEAVKLLQGCMGLGQDGVFGPETLIATNAHDGATLAAMLRDAQEEHYLAIEKAVPADVRFDGGWRKRAYAHYPDLPS